MKTNLNTLDLESGKLEKELIEVPDVRTRAIDIVSHCVRAFHKNHAIVQSAHYKGRSLLSYRRRRLAKQKGLGIARVGSASSPIRRGGSACFGFSDQSTRLKKPNRINKKVVSLGIQQAILNRILNGGFVVIKGDTKKIPLKTRDCVSMFDLLSSVGVVKSNIPRFVASCSRIGAFNGFKNMKCNLSNLESFNIVAILNSSVIVMHEADFETLRKRYLIKVENDKQ